MDDAKNLEHVTAERDRLELASRVQSIALLHGARPDAVSFILLKAAQEWQMQDGKPVPIKDGLPAFSQDGLHELTMQEWVAQIATDAPCMFLAGKAVVH